MDPYAWSWNPEALVLVPTITTVYLLLARGLATPVWRKVCFLAAMAMLLSITITPFETISLKYLLSIHLLQNVVLAEWGPLLVVLGVAPALARELARSGIVRAVTHPLVALPLWLGTYAFWHIPSIYNAALRHPHSLLHLEHATYFLSGVAMFWPVFQDVPRRLSSGGRAAYGFAAFVLGAPLPPLPPPLPPPP